MAAASPLRSRLGAAEKSFLTSARADGRGTPPACRAGCSRAPPASGREEEEEEEEEEEGEEEEEAPLGARQGAPLAVRAEHPLVGALGAVGSELILEWSVYTSKILCYCC
nr:PHD finger protein 23-like isoform X1 [Anser cygnoides]